MSNFDRALALLLGHEGGLSDHALDRGGRTNLGITQATYNNWRTKQGLMARKVDHITMDEVKAIYRRDYWDACKCDEMPWVFAYPTFDAAVNSGPSRARKWLQQGLGVTADGIIGPATLAAAKAAPMSKALDVVKARGDFVADLVKGNTSQAVFLKGWMRRLFDVVRKVVEA